MKKSSVVVVAVLLAVCLLVGEIDAQGGRRSRLSPAERRARRQERLERRRERTTTTTQRPCPPIPHVTNGQGLDTGNTVQYACEPGFVLEGTNVITCIDGRWTVAPRCRRQLCRPPMNIPFATPPVLSNQGMTATYTCNPGYQIVGGNGATTVTINCNPNTDFWPNTPQCALIPPVSCSAPPSIANAQSTLSSTGTTATYSCVAGYRFKAGSSTAISCVNGVWPTTGLPMCEVDPTTIVAVKCVRAPPCGDEKIVREDVSDSYEVGGKVKYTCITGYRIVGGNDNTNQTGHAYCLSDGTWSPTPTCEKVNCGVPPAGTQTKTVVASATMFGDTYTYACNDNYEFGNSLVSTCMADGKWSLIPAPTCTQKMCKKEKLPTVANSNSAATDVVIGGTFTFTCNGNYRVAPTANPAAPATAITITCQSDGNFTAPVGTCVYIYPENCTDYFRRDNLFASASASCTTVRIDPQGPFTTGVATSSNPGEVEVNCCKQNTDQVCTQVTPTVTAPAISSTATVTCTGTTDGVLMPGTTADGTNSFFCDYAGSVSYGMSETEIINMIKSTRGTCTQTTTLRCDTTTQDVAPIIRLNGEASGVMYGTGAFVNDPNANPGGDPQVVVADDLALTPDTYIGGLCDCAVTSTTDCPGGCRCVDDAVLGTGTSDTITKELTARSPRYVTNFGYSAHDAIASPVLDAAGEMDITVGNIVCCETFVA